MQSAIPSRTLVRCRENRRPLKQSREIHTLFCSAASSRDICMSKRLSLDGICKKRSETILDQRRSMRPIAGQFRPENLGGRMAEKLDIYSTYLPLDLILGRQYLLIGGLRISLEGCRQRNPQDCLGQNAGCRKGADRDSIVREWVDEANTSETVTNNIN